METVDQAITDNILNAFADLNKSTKQGAINNIILTTPSGKSALFDAYQEWQKKEESK